MTPMRSARIWLQLTSKPSFPPRATDATQATRPREIPLAQSRGASVQQAQELAPNCYPLRQNPRVIPRLRQSCRGPTVDTLYPRNLANHICAPQPRPEGSSPNYTMTLNLAFRTDDAQLAKFVEWRRLIISYCHEIIATLIELWLASA